MPVVEEFELDEVDPGDPTPATRARRRPDLQQRPAVWVSTAVALAAVGVLVAPDLLPRTVSAVSDPDLALAHYVVMGDEPMDAIGRGEVVVALDVEGSVVTPLADRSPIGTEPDLVIWVSRAVPLADTDGETIISTSTLSWDAAVLLDDQRPRTRVDWVCEDRSATTAWCSSLDDDPIELLIDLEAQTVTVV